MKNISIPSDKLAAFAALLEVAQLQSLIDNRVDCECNRTNAKTSVKIGGKYARVDIGTSGRYMVVLATGEIFGVKAYGVIHKGHYFGTLDTIAEWDWRNYRACRRASRIMIASRAAHPVPYIYADVVASLDSRSASQDNAQTI